MKKIRLFIAFWPLHVGGATTALINFLHCLDYSRYDVDLMLREHAGRDARIPKEVHLLAPSRASGAARMKALIRLALSPVRAVRLFRGLCEKHLFRRGKIAAQILSREGVCDSLRIGKAYDVAIAYDVLWPLYYVASYIHARSKICWMHVDYDSAGYDYRLDQIAIEVMDRLVFVSENCMKNFAAAHPACASKCAYIPNITAEKPIIDAARESVEFSSARCRLALISVCRIDFPHKGLDRGVNAFIRLKAENRLEGVRWTIIGDGPDAASLSKLIEREALGEYICYLGEKKNPLPYMARSHALFLPSRFEGKPMVVTEAQILHLVPVVTAYASATEQIRDGIDGIILQNNDETVYLGLKKLIEKPQVLKGMRERLAQQSFGNVHEMIAFDMIIDALLRE